MINVLFMQSQTYFGADSYIHSLIMKELDRSWITVHVACNYGKYRPYSAAPQDTAVTPGSHPSNYGNAGIQYAAQALEKIPDIHLRPTKFGASVNFRKKVAVVYDTVVDGVPTALSLAGLAKYIRDNHIQIIHCTEKPRDAFYGQLLANLTGAKCVIQLHVKVEDWMSNKVLWAMRQADGLIGVSQFVADSIIEMGYSPEKTFYTLNAIECDRWDPTIDGRPIREEFNISPDTPLLLAVSRLTYWKGYTELFKALAEVKKQVPHFKMLVVGDDDIRAHPGHGSYMAELKVLAAELDITDNVIFTGFRSDIPEFMAACDIYAMPSYGEPFGMVFLEAMAMKKPVVALDHGGSREVVEHNKCGLLSAPHDIDQLAQNILTLIHDPELRRCMGEYGRTRAENYFTPRRMAEDVEGIYRQVLQINEPVVQA